VVLGALRFGLAARLAVAAVPNLTGLGRLVGGLRAVGAGRRLAFGVAGFEQGIALELGVDIGDQVEIGELQQLDGLHQLRRHHQRLALPYLQSLRERHEGLWRMRLLTWLTDNLVRFLLISLSYIFHGVASLFLSGLRPAAHPLNALIGSVF